jgi:hypothetical protein
MTTHTTTHTTIRRRALRALARAHVRALALAAPALGVTACKLDVVNPNAATEVQVLTTAAGLRALTVGMQGRLGNALEEGIWIPGLVAGELGNTAASLSNQREFQRFPQAGANAQIEDASNIDLIDLWAKYYGVVRSADDILNNVDRVTLAPGTRSGMTALAKTMKAIAFGTLIEAFQQIPIETTQDQPPFADRATVLRRALELLASARSDLAAQAPSAEFTNTLLTPGLDLPATIRAMQARYSLAAGDYAQALAFANEVPATASAAIAYAGADRNPLRDPFYGVSYFAAFSSFRTGAEAGDTRVARFTTTTTPSAFGGTSLTGLNVYRNDTDPIPLFTQDELTLIRAEAHARTNRLAEAITEVNRVRQAAGLPARDAAALPSQQAVLDEILRQRGYSLFLTGLRWADLRRFNRVSEAKVPWLPFPFSERSTNPNTPANPTAP